jgi:hypothetical protein
MFYQPVVLVNLPGKSGIAHEFHLPMAPWPRPWGRWGCQWRPNSWKVSSSLAQWIEMWGKLLPQFPVRGGLWFKNYDVYNEHVDYIYTSTWLMLDISKIMFELFCCFNKGVLKPTNNRKHHLVRIGHMLHRLRGILAVTGLDFLASLLTCDWYRCKHPVGIGWYRYGALQCMTLYTFVVISHV